MRGRAAAEIRVLSRVMDQSAYQRKRHARPKNYIFLPIRQISISGGKKICQNEFKTPRIGLHRRGCHADLGGLPPRRIEFFCHASSPAGLLKSYSICADSAEREFPVGPRVHPTFFVDRFPVPGSPVYEEFNLLSLIWYPCVFRFVVFSGVSDLNFRASFTHGRSLSSRDHSHLHFCFCYAHFAYVVSFWTTTYCTHLHEREELYSKSR
jgi:hypothetical protein